MPPSAEEKQSPSEKADAETTNKASPAESTDSKAQSDNIVDSGDVEAQTEKTEDGDGAGFNGLPPEDESQYPGPRSVAMIVLAIYLAMFLVSLVSRFHPQDTIAIALHHRTNRVHRTVPSSPPPSPA